MDKPPLGVTLATWYQRAFFRNTVTILLILLVIFIAYQLMPLIGTIFSFFATILYPFVLTFFIYYLVRPLVRKLNKKMPLPVAIGIVYILVIGLIVFLVTFVYPIIIKQIVSLQSINIDKIINFKNETVDKILNTLGISMEGDSKTKDTITSFLLNINTAVIKGVGEFITNLTGFVLALVTVPFIMFFLLKDGDLIYTSFCNKIPKKYLSYVKDLLKDIDVTMLHFINGRVLISLITSLGLFIAFLIMGIGYPFILALISLIFYFVPTIGSFIAMIPPILVGFSMSTYMGLGALIVTSIASAVEGFVISPLIMGKHLFIHPLTTILILLIGGSLWGIWGLLLATPAYALTKVLFTHTYRFIEESDLESTT